MKPFKVRECFNLVSRGKSPQYVEQSDVKVVNQACIYWEGLNLNKVKYQDESKNYDKGLICSGDVLVNSTGTGTLGRAAVVPHVAETEKLIADSHVTILRPNTDIINPYYFTYYLQDSRNQERLYSQCVNGSTNQIELSKEKLSELMITLPKIDEQGIIVDKLRKIDEVRNKRQKQLEKLDELVKARFVEMFGDPVRNEMCWEQKPLSTCLESIDNGKSFVCDSAAREDDWPAVLKLSAATYGFYRPEENKAMLDENQFVEDAAVRAGDLLFTRKNTPELVGMCAYVYSTPAKLMMPDLIFRLNTAEKCNKIFLWKLINHELFRECIQAIATGSAKSMSNISKERLLGLKIIFPPIELQDQFASFVKQTDKSKAEIKKSLDELEMLKKALMQKCFG